MSEEGQTLSISEALTELQQEFPEVTISKIRFLEGQGLIEPERNASGYRQFRETDVQQLTWILRQQRDRFLPLKVIKRALDRGVDIHDAGDGDQPTLWSAVADAAAVEEQEASAHDTADDESATPQDKSRHPATAGQDPCTEPEPTASPVNDRNSPAAPEQAKAVGAQDDPSEAPEDTDMTSNPEPAKRHNTPADVVAALQEDPRASAPKSQGRATRRQRPVLEVNDESSGRTFTPEELAQAAGVSFEMLEDLERFGLIEAVMRGTEVYYDEHCLRVAALAAASAERGIEPRHLRIYKVAAEREAGFIEQLVMPLLKRRNPESRAKALAEANELAALGAEMHAAVLARELHPDIGRSLGD